MACGPLEILLSLPLFSHRNGGITATMLLHVAFMCILEIQTQVVWLVYQALMHGAIPPARLVLLNTVKMMLTSEAGLDAFCIVNGHEPMETEVEDYGLKLICLRGQPGKGWTYDG